MAIANDITVFTVSDGFTPLQTSKLNSNFKRIIALTNNVVTKSQSIDIQAVAEAVATILQPRLLKLELPIGSVIGIKDGSLVPDYGVWELQSSWTNKFIKATDGTTPPANDTTPTTYHDETTSVYLKFYKRKS